MTIIYTRIFPQTSTLKLLLRNSSQQSCSLWYQNHQNQSSLQAIINDCAFIHQKDNSDTTQLQIKEYHSNQSNTKYNTVHSQKIKNKANKRSHLLLTISKECSTSITCIMYQNLKHIFYKWYQPRMRHLLFPKVRSMKTYSSNLFSVMHYAL